MSICGKKNVSWVTTIINTMKFKNPFVLVHVKKKNVSYLQCRTRETQPGCTVLRRVRTGQLGSTGGLPYTRWLLRPIPAHSKFPGSTAPQDATKTIRFNSYFSSHIFHLLYSKGRKLQKAFFVEFYLLFCSLTEHRHCFVVVLTISLCVMHSKISLSLK